MKYELNAEHLVKGLPRMRKSIPLPMKEARSCQAAKASGSLRSI